MQSRALVKQIQSLLDERRPRTQAAGRTIVGRGPRMDPSLTDEDINEFDDLAYFFDKNLKAYQPYLHRKYKNNKPKIVAEFYRHHPAKNVNQMLKKGPDMDDESSAFAAATFKRQMDRRFKREPVEWEDEGKKFKMKKHSPSMDFAYEALDYFDSKGHKIDRETIDAIHKEKARVAAALTQDGKAPTSEELNNALEEDEVIRQQFLETVYANAEKEQDLNRQVSRGGAMAA